jgi:hypothetical protein
LNATGKDFSRIKRSILRIGCSQSRRVFIYFSFDQPLNSGFSADIFYMGDAGEIVN